MSEQLLVEYGGHRLAVRRAGDKGRPAMLLLHGWPLTSAVWQQVIEPLAVDHHVLAFDLPGIGQSACAAGASSLAQRIRGAVIMNTVIPGLDPRRAEDRLRLVPRDAGGCAAQQAAPADRPRMNS